MPIHEDFALHHAITECLKILTERVYSFAAAGETEIARDVIKKLCYIGLDHGTELKSTAETDQEKTYELSDVNNTTVGAERLRCAEVMFQPYSIIHDTSFRNIMECDVDTRKEVVRQCRAFRWHGQNPRQIFPERHEV